MSLADGNMDKRSRSDRLRRADELADEIEDLMKRLDAVTKTLNEELHNDE